VRGGNRRASDGRVSHGGSPRAGYAAPTLADVGASVGWGLVVGSSLLAGALVAAAVRLPPRVAAALTAFGGGVLLAAIALELVPEADAEAGTGLTAMGLLVGTGAYVAIDAWLNRREEMKMTRRAMHAAAAGGQMQKPSRAGEVSRGESIAAGLFVDGVPESLALGLTIAEGEIGVALLAGIVLGNVVEAYGATQPIIIGGRSKRFAVGLLASIGAALALATVLGGTVLAEASPELVGSAQAIAAGAVLAVVSIAIIPHAFSEVSSVVASAIVAGFVVGYLLS
jgi:zinc transporter, ZIP family